MHLEMVHVQVLPGGKTPRYQTEGAAGMDLRYSGESSVVIEAGLWSLIPTGIKIALGEGVEAQVRPRSGLALEHGVTVLNSPGTIDSDYRGEVKVLLINHGSLPFSVEPGARIAQLVIAPVCRAMLALCDELPPTSRGSGGFGSTGAT